VENRSLNKAACRVSNAFRKAIAPALLFGALGGANCTRRICVLRLTTLAEAHRFSPLFATATSPPSPMGALQKGLCIPRQNDRIQ
jgi:hypothetical protein